MDIAGYARTGFSGKWHLGINSNSFGEAQDHRFTPTAHGCASKLWPMMSRFIHSLIAYGSRYDTYLGAPYTNMPACAMDSDTGKSTKYKKVITALSVNPSM